MARRMTSKIIAGVRESIRDRVVPILKAVNSNFPNRMFLFCSKPNPVMPALRRNHLLPKQAETSKTVSRRSISRVLSASCDAGRPFLWDRFRNLPRRDQPGRRNGNVPAGLCCHSRTAAPIRSCSRWGLPCQRRYRHCGALLPPRFTLTVTTLRRVRRFVFCGTIPGVAPAGG
jgi:hypothetical protein